MKYVNKLKENYPQLVEEYAAMSKDELLDQICAEVIDLHNMESRVQVFMNECTVNMSKTTYTEESIKLLISQKQEQDIIDFCINLIEVYNDVQLLQAVKELATPHQTEK